MKFRLEIIAPPADLAGTINTFYVIESDEARIEEVMPAYSAQIGLVIRGRMGLTYADGSVGSSSDIIINAPQLSSANTVLEGQFTVIGASFTHLGWQRFANLPADQVHDRMLPAGELIAPAQLARLEAAAAEGRAGRLTLAEMSGILGEAIASRSYNLRPDHVAVVEAMTRWLGSAFDPPLSALYDELAISPRQVQRISRRFFGVAPAQVLKRFRAIRAAMVLVNPALPDSFRDEMLASFFDQAHLIRDIRRYTGRTPTQLRAHSLSSGLLDPTGHGEAAELLRPEAD